MKSPSLRRRGIGTTLGIVLILIGLILLAILGVDSIGRGSRFTMERSFAATRAIAMAGLAIEEACRSTANRQAILDAIMTRLDETSPDYDFPDTPDGTESELRTVLGVVAPLNLYQEVRDILGDADPESITTEEYGDDLALESLPVPGFPALRYLSGHRVNTVAFTWETPIRLTPSLLTQVNAGDAGLVDPGSIVVEVTPLLYGLDSPYTGVGGAVGPVGRGVLRARCRVEYRMGGHSASRWVTQDRFFSFMRIFEPGTGYRWSLDTSPFPWQVESLENET